MNWGVLFCGLFRKKEKELVYVDEAELINKFNLEKVWCGGKEYYVLESGSFVLLGQIVDPKQQPDLLQLELEQQRSGQPGASNLHKLDRDMVNCKKIMVGKQVLPLRNDLKMEIKKIARKYAEDGLWVKALAKENVFLGLLGYRASYKKELLERFLSLGRKKKKMMIFTQRDKFAAWATFGKMGILSSKSQILESGEFLACPSRDVSRRVVNVCVFATSEADFKKSVLDLLRRDGHRIFSFQKAY